MNKTITLFIGECWHEGVRSERLTAFPLVKCKKCGKVLGRQNFFTFHSEALNPRFDTPEGFFKLLPLAKELGVVIAEFLDPKQLAAEVVRRIHETGYRNMRPEVPQCEVYREIPG